MSKDTRNDVAHDLAKYIKANPASSNMILTVQSLKSHWQHSVIKSLDEFGVNIEETSKYDYAIAVEGNESRHQPTVSFVSWSSPAIIGRRVTGICVFDMHFFRATNRMKEEFKEMSKDLDYRNDWFLDNSPLSKYILLNIAPAFMDGYQLWSCGFSEDLSPRELQVKFPEIVTY